MKPHWVHQPVATRNRRWNSCNLIQFAPDAKRLWQFDAKGGGYVLGREQRVPHTQPLPATFGAKNWSSLWQPKLNIAWLPPENVFLRVVELPASSLEETVSMVELQLEKLSPVPVAQVVWMMHVLGTHSAPPKGDAPPESLQTVIVVIVPRAVVEMFLGKLAQEGFLADKLEAPMLDQLEAIAPKEDGAWIIPVSIAGQYAAMVGWWSGGVLRQLSFISLPAAGDRAAELKNQLSLLVMAGEVEGWLTAQPKWHVVADPANASEWEQLLRATQDEPVEITQPLPTVELAGRTAKRSAAGSLTNLLPAEYTQRYKTQFHDRLWLHGLGYAGLIYAIFLAIYFSATTFLGYRTNHVESQVAQISNDYTNTIQLRARYNVLKTRGDLKYAALNCWQAVAQALPAGLTIQRFSFQNGSKLGLNGVCPQDQISQITEKDQFYDGVRKAATPDGQPLFVEEPADPLTYRVTPNGVAWNFGLRLQHSEASVK